MDIIYQGVNPPSAFDGEPMESGLRDDEVKAIWDAGRQGSPDFQIIVQNGAERKFYVPFEAHAPDPTKGRNITTGEFLKVGYAIGLADKIDATLSSMMSLGFFLQQYISYPGIEFEDAIPSQAPSTIRTAFARMQSAGYVDDDKIGQFIAAWIQMYPQT